MRSPFAASACAARMFSASVAVRYVCAVLLGALTWLVAPPGASSMTPGELLSSCADIVSKVGPKAGDEIDIPQTGLSCWYYMSAIQNMSVLETPRGVRLLGICAPPETTLMDYVRVFVAQGRKRKAQGENAAAFAVVMLSDAFPCGARTHSR
jgi:Rap1a immunity proteins